MKIGKKFQWIKSENIGQEVTVTGTEDGFTLFNNGTRCNTSLINEYMLEVDNTAEALPLSTDLGKIVPATKKPTPKATKREVGDNLFTGSPENPIRELLKRQSSNNKMRSELTIDVKIPKPSVYGILKESFGDDVDTEITQMAIESIDITELKDKLDKLIKNKVKQYYLKSKK